MMKYIDMLEDKFRGEGGTWLRVAISATLIAGLVYWYKFDYDILPALGSGLCFSFLAYLFAGLSIVIADHMGYEEDKILSSDNTVNIYKMNEKDFERVLWQASGKGYVTYNQIEQIKSNWK